MIATSQFFYAGAPHIKYSYVVYLNVNQKSNCNQLLGFGTHPTKRKDNLMARRMSIENYFQCILIN